MSAEATSTSAGCSSSTSSERPLAPRVALAVGTLERLVPDRRVDERAGRLGDGPQSPAALVRQRLERRQPLLGVGVAQEQDRCRGIRGPVPAVGGSTVA